METLKKKIVQALSIAPQIEALQQNNLIVTTAFGIISGKLYDDKKASDASSGGKLLSALSNRIAEAYGPENIEGSDGFLLLTDATITTSANVKINVGDIIVFYDQIIGVSIGKIS